MDLAQIAARRGIDLNSLAQMNQMDPQRDLEYLTGASRSRELGWARLRGGALARHYALTIDLRRLAKENIEFRRALKNVPRFARRLPAEAWIDERGLLRKLTLRFTLARSADGPVQMRMTEEFYGFGVHAHVTAPPANQVTDATRLLGH